MRLLDKQEVVGSIPTSPTTKTPANPRVARWPMAELLTRQSHGWYAPDDPKSPRQNAALRQTYFNAVGEILSDRKGLVVHLEEELGGDPWIVAEAVECWRRLGWVIEGERGRPGYRFVATCRPRRWLRLDGVFVEFKRAIVTPVPRRRRQVEPLAGQVAWC